MRHHHGDSPDRGAVAVQVVASCIAVVVVVTALLASGLPARVSCAIGASVGRVTQSEESGTPPHCASSDRSPTATTAKSRLGPTEESSTGGLSVRLLADTEEAPVEVFDVGEAIRDDWARHGGDPNRPQLVIGLAPGDDATPLDIDDAIDGDGPPLLTTAGRVFTDGVAGPAHVSDGDSFLHARYASQLMYSITRTWRTLFPDTTRAVLNGCVPPVITRTVPDPGIAALVNAPGSDPPEAYLLLTPEVFERADGHLAMAHELGHLAVACLNPGFDTPEGHDLAVEESFADTFAGLDDVAAARRSDLVSRGDGDFCDPTRGADAHRDSAAMTAVWWELHDALAQTMSPNRARETMAQLWVFLVSTDTVWTVQTWGETVTELAVEAGIDEDVVADALARRHWDQYVAGACADGDSADDMEDDDTQDSEPSDADEPDVDMPDVTLDPISAALPPPGVAGATTPLGPAATAVGSAIGAMAALPGGVAVIEHPDDRDDPDDPDEEITAASIVAALQLHAALQQLHAALDPSAALNP